MPEQLTPIIPLAHIYIVRHGETHENRAGIIQGQLDTKLNDAGIMQAEMLGEAMKGVKFAKAWTSDLGRASEVS
jgi:probable phosphoglycerate mutase